jgi:hypothetical protein
VHFDFTVEPRTMDLAPSAIGDGIVFVLARWSPDAVMRWEELLERLASTKWQGKVVLVDESAEGFDRAEFAKGYAMPLHGWGEAFAVASGRVICSSSAEDGASLEELVTALGRP